MSKHSRKQPSQRSRDAPAQHKRSSVMLCSHDAWTALCGDGYKPITQCPEVMMCVNVYADLIASMTIHLMANTDQGDVRVKNELSKKLDIAPNRNLTRSTFMALIVETLLTHGNQVTVPVYRGGYLEDLLPVPPSQVAMRGTAHDYEILIGGKPVSPETVLHFAWKVNPERPWEGRGVTASLRDIVRGLRQADGTRKALLQSPAPSLIIKMDAYTEEMQTPEGRERMRAQYVDSSENGKPWIVAADAMSVEQVRPLTLSDLAINESLTLDKRAAAALFGVPPFMVGVGDFNASEYNNFVSTRVLALAKIIEQELSKKLLLSPDLYWRFNNRSLMSYALNEIISAGSAMVDRMAMRRNEWRDWIGLAPDPDMHELLALENYVPADRLGDQKKLNEPDNSQGGGASDGETDDRPV